MPYPLHWRSVDLYQYVTSLLWLSPVQWISNKQQFTLVPLSSFRLIPWHFIGIFAFFGYGVVGSFYIPIRENISPTENVSIVQSLVLFSLGMIIGFGWCINFAIVTVGTRSVLVINRLINFYKGLSDGI
jgi:hypothetical protein